MAGYKNIKPRYKKGESGNPNGRPKGSKNRATILRELLDTLSDFTNPVTKSKEKMEVEKAMDLAIIGKALKGDVNAYKEIKDTVYGKIANVNELTGKDGGMIEINQTTVIKPKIDDDEPKT